MLLHDHLDGGLRPRRSSTWRASTATRACRRPTLTTLAAAFTAGADRKSLVLYLEGFEHTVGVMQTPDAIERVAFECAEDLADDGVVYAEVRYAPELSTRDGLSLDEVVQAILRGFARGERETGHPHGLHRHCHAPVRAIRRDRRARHPLPRRWRRRLRRRRTGGRLSADPLPGRVQPHPPGQLPSDDPRRRGVRAAVDLGGAAVVRRTSTRPRRAHRRRHQRRRRRGADDGPPRDVRARPARAARDVPDLECPHRRRGVDRGTSDRPAAPAALPRDGQHRQPADERRDDDAASSRRCRASSTLASTRCSG